MKHLILFMLLIITSFKPNEACVRNSVIIQNDLGLGGNLELHCSSKHNDLGIKNLSYKFSYTTRLDGIYFMRNLSIPSVLALRWKKK
ncbi:hypothetical protein N665_0557s0040 [Sinapis alba]|nr:hypothetical protein N665_0557s0040 [Sinapis alba]